MAKKFEIPLQKAPTIEEAYANLIGNSDSTIIKLPLNKLDEISDQPFVINEEKISQIAESIRSVGVLEPIIVRQKDDGRYDILSGRHRFRACQQLNETDIPCFIRKDLTDEMARFILIATNTDRNNEYPPSVYAKAYKEQMELYKKLGKKAVDLASEQGVNKKTIYRYIRLNNLISEFLEMVDSGEISLVTGVELSYYNIDSQTTLLNFTTNMCMKITLDFVKKIRKEYSELDEDILNEICFGLSKEEKQIQVENDIKQKSSTYLDYDKINENFSANSSTTSVESNDMWISEKEKLSQIKNNLDEDDEYNFDESDFEDEDILNKQSTSEIIEPIIEPINLTIGINKKTFEEINQMCDSGMFNSIIQGYILLAFDEAGIKLNTALDKLLDNYSAQDARDRYER